MATREREERGDDDEDPRGATIRHAAAAPPPAAGRPRGRIAMTGARTASRRVRHDLPSVPDRAPAGTTAQTVGHAGAEEEEGG